MNEKTEIQSLTIETIKSKIYEIRGIHVMFDKDLAVLYQITTSNLNKAVKRNIERFPNDFMFQLTKDEMNNMVFQNGISKQGGNRFNSFVFTELGIAMLSSVLHSPIAIQVNINIMRAFVAMRHSIDMLKDVNLKIDGLQIQMKELNDTIDDILSTQNDINEDTSMQLELLNQSLAELQADKTLREEFEKRNPIGFKIQK